MRTIASDQVASKDLEGLVAIEFPCDRQDAALILLKVDHRRAAQDSQSRNCCRVCEQHGFEIDLVDPMRGFGRRPPGIGAALRSVAFGATGNRDAPELNSGRGGAKGDVVRVVGGQASVAHSAYHPEPTEDLHRARADVVASHARWLAGGSPLGDGYVDAASSEVHGQCQADGPSADN
jgi:hypothetical protein